MERAGEVWLFPSVTRAPVSVAVVSRSRGLSVMGAVAWSALLVGGGLAGALFVWLLRDSGKEGNAGVEEGRPPRGGCGLRAEIRGGGGGGLSPGPSAKPQVFFLLCLLGRFARGL